MSETVFQFEEHEIDLEEHLLNVEKQRWKQQFDKVIKSINTNTDYVRFRSPISLKEISGVNIPYQFFPIKIRIFGHKYYNKSQDQYDFLRYADNMPWDHVRFHGFNTKDSKCEMMNMARSQLEEYIRKNYGYDLYRDLEKTRSIIDECNEALEEEVSTIKHYENILKI